MAERSFLIPISSSQIGKRTQISRRGIFPAPEKWVHAIPTVVVFCFFILWWFSHPVSIDIKDRRQMLSIHRIKNPPSMTVAKNDSRLDMAILTSFSIAPVSNQNLTHHNSTQPLLKERLSNPKALNPSLANKKPC